MALGEAGLVVVGLGSQPRVAEGVVQRGVELAGRLVPAEPDDKIGIAVALSAGGDLAVQSRPLRLQTLALGDLGGDPREVHLMQRCHQCPSLPLLFGQQVSQLMERIEELVVETYRLLAGALADFRHLEREFQASFYHRMSERRGIESRLYPHLCQLYAARRGR